MTEMCSGLARVQPVDGGTAVLGAAWNTRTGIGDRGGLISLPFTTEALQDLVLHVDDVVPAMGW